MKLDNSRVRQVMQSTQESKAVAEFLSNRRRNRKIINVYRLYKNAAKTHSGLNKTQFGATFSELQKLGAGQITKDEYGNIYRFDLNVKLEDLLKAISDKGLEEETRKKRIKVNVTPKQPVHYDRYTLSINRNGEIIIKNIDNLTDTDINKLAKIISAVRRHSLWV